MPPTEKMLADLSAHKAERPNIKCAVDGCLHHRQDAWDAIKYTPAPKGWTCRCHEAEI